MNECFNTDISSYPINLGMFEIKYSNKMDKYKISYPNGETFYFYRGLISDDGIHFNMSMSTVGKLFSCSNINRNRNK